MTNKTRIFMALLLLSCNVQAQIFTTTTGVAFFEAEQFTNSISRSSRSWEIQTVTTGYSGTGYVVVTNSGVSASNINTSVETTSPELQFGISFPTVGTYRVLARGYGIDGTEDSFHVGLDGVWPASGSNLSWGTYNTWVWTNSGPGGLRTITVGSPGLHTLNVWMREDGARIDRLGVYTDVNFRASIGNSFHIPSGFEADLPRPTMRFPLSTILSNTDVEIYNGNQFQGGSNGANQLVTGSAVFYRTSTNDPWTHVPMHFVATGVYNANNKYLGVTIPGGTFNAGDLVQYYLRIPYSDRLPTYLYGTDSSVQKSELESAAQASPFTFVVQSSYLSISNLTPMGYVEARVFTNSGDIIVLGPDLNGNQLTNALYFTPAARIGGVNRNMGAVLSSTVISNGLELVQQLYTSSVTSRLTFLAEGIVRYEVVDWGGLSVDQTVVSSPSDSSEHFYGFGEKFNSLDQAGNSVHMITDDPPGSPKGDKSYKVAPWFISTRGYGFHFDSSAESYFNMRADTGNRYVISNLFGVLKFNIVYGPKITDVLTRYTGYTGRPPLSPPWAFASWMSSDIWHSGGEVRFLLTKMREQGISSSVLVFDSPWETSYNDFTWNMTQFGLSMTNNIPGEPATNWTGFTSVNDMMTFVRSNGFKLICWMTPFINTNSNTENTGYYGPGGVPGANTGKSTNYNEAAASNYFARSSSNGPPLVVQWWKGRGSPVDYTNPDATRWLQNQLSNLVAQSGNVIGGFKTDDGESGNPPGSYIPDSAVYFDGRTGLEMQNGYAAEYHKAIWNVLGTNGLLFARSGFTGSHAYPGYWAGDNEPNFGAANGLPSVVVAAMSSAMSGYSIWASDVGGYQDTAFSSHLTNLFMRWTQFGTFSGLMQMHRKVDADLQYPWSFGSAGLSNYVYYCKFRTALFPYIYTYAQQSSTNGLPIMRPLVLMNQSDTNTYAVQHTYTFGDELLISTIITNIATTRQVYLPAGTWYDYWTRARYNGGQNIIWTNFEQIKYPIFVRGGAIIPLIASNIQTLVDASYIGHSNLVTMDTSLEFLVFPSSNSSFRVYDNTLAECQTNETVTHFTLSSDDRNALLRIFTPQPAGVERNGVRLPKLTNSASFAAATLGWMYDASSGFTLAKWNHIGGSAQITMGPDSIGDGIPDSWRQSHFGSATTTNEFSCAACDADIDGLNNMDEYRSGTDPNNINDFLKVRDTTLLPAPTSTVRISWSSQPGIPYKMQRKNDMSDAALWQLLSNDFVGDGSILFLQDYASATSNPGFYRLSVP